MEATVLRFRILRSKWGCDDYQWIALGSRADEDEDLMWGNFNTWSDAIGFVTTILKNGGKR